MRNSINSFGRLSMISLLLLAGSCKQEAVPKVVLNETALRYQGLNLPDQPNILWLVAEDLSPYLPFYGDSTIITPNLSALASDGIVFDQFYSPAPVCAPARACIATGMYPTRISAGHMRTGGNPKYFPEGITPYEAIPPIGTRMMSEWLRMQGYYCTNNSKEDYQFDKTPTAWDESGTEAHWRHRPSSQPFFSVFNFNVTHESKIWAKAGDSLLVDPNLEIPVPPYLPNTTLAKDDVRRMYSNIVEMDRQVGAILQQLRADGLLENTVVFWYSDHGGPLPRQKRLLYDSGIKVPMIIRFPGQQFAGTRDERLTSFLDLAPTVLSLANIEPKTYMDGRDFLGKSQPKTLRKYVHAAADRFDASTDCNRAVRDERYKYIRYYKPELPMFLHVDYRDQMPIMQELYRLKEKDSLNAIQMLWFRETKPAFEFFDTKLDPHEINNLADDPSYAQKINEFSAECDRWLSEISDVGIIPERELQKIIWPDGTKPETKNPQVKIEKRNVTISCPTEGASIGYKIFSSGEPEPKSWQVYDEPFTLDGDKMLVIAHRIGFTPSEILTFQP